MAEEARAVSALRRAVVRTTMLAMASIGLPGVALAHSELRSTSPRDGARLAVAPTRIELAFNEDVQVTALRLFDAAGAEILLPRRRAREPRRGDAVELPALAAGGYRVRWAAISADGHPISGTFRFEVSGRHESTP